MALLQVGQTKYLWISDGNYMSNSCRFDVGELNDRSAIEQNVINWKHTVRHRTRKVYVPSGPDAITQTLVIYLLGDLQLTYSFPHSPTR